MTKGYAVAAVLVGAFALAGTMDYNDAVALERELKDRGSWDFVGEAYRPADLRDCRPEDVIAISYNSGVESPWRRFCSSSFSEKTTRPGRASK